MCTNSLCFRLWIDHIASIVLQDFKRAADSETAQDLVRTCSVSVYTVKTVETDHLKYRHLVQTGLGKRFLPKPYINTCKLTLTY